MNALIKILFVGGTPTDWKVAERELGTGGRKIISSYAGGAGEVESLLGTFAPDVVISCLEVPLGDGLKVLELCHRHAAAVPFVVVCGQFDDESVGAWIRAGADECVLQNQPAQLPFAVRAANERRRSHSAGQLAVRRGHELLRAVEQSPSSIIITDAEGRIEYVNPTFMAVTGYSSTEAVGKNSRALLSAHGSPELYSEMLHAIAEQGSWQGEIQHRKKSGEMYWEHARVSSIRDEAGHVTHFVAVQEEITKKKLAEAKLVELKKRLLLSERHERLQIANELHESTVQNLVAVQLNLNRVVQLLGSGNAEVRQLVEDCVALLENDASDLRSLAYDLHAPWLQHGGMVSGVRDYAGHFSLRTGIEVVTKVATEIPRLAALHEITLFRVMQESLENIEHHGGTKRARILFSLRNHRLRMTITEECATGSARAAARFVPRSDGMLSMGERMAAIGGTLKFKSFATGTSIVAVLPMESDADDSTA